MAHALETDPINQLEENLQCSVCLEALADPRTLPCCHSFCKDCLEGVVKTCRDKAARDGRRIREFPCPDCRTMFTLEPDQNVADMPRNHFICNMVQVIAVLDRGTRVPCSLHDCSQSSVSRCVTCEKFLCRECLADHNKYRGHNDHSVLTMEELSKPENRAKIKGKIYCNEHSNKTLKVYCETCDKLICKDCMYFKHVKQNHSCHLVKDVASNYKKLLVSSNKAMEDALTEGNLFLQRLLQTTDGLDGDVENAKRGIVQRKELIAKKAVEMLNQKAETHLKEVEGIHKRERAKLDSQTNETKHYVENIKQSVQLSKKLVEHGTEEEIISSQKVMLENANNLLRKRSEYFKEKIPVTRVRYIPGASKEPLDDDNVRAIENSLGKIVEGDDVKGSNQAGNKNGQRNKSMVFSTIEFDQPAKVNKTSQGEQPNAGDQNNGAKKAFGKETRHQMVNKPRFGDNSDQDKTLETFFDNAKVKVNDDFIKKIKEAEFQDMLGYQNVKYNKGYLSGTWNGIHAVGRYIASYFAGSENEKDQGNGSSYSSFTSFDQSLGSPTSAADQSSGSPSSAVVKSTGVQTSTIDQPAPRKQPDETFTVNSLFLRYILAYHYQVFENLESVSKEISFEEKSKCHKDLKITARENVDGKKFLKIVDEFIDFYSSKHQKMHQENVLTKSEIDQAVISEARLKFSVVIDSTTELDKLTIYGEKDEVLKAKEFLQSKDGDLHRSLRGKPVPSEPTPEKTEEKVVVEKLSCTLFKNIEVSVYQGDITKETADVIVNPANEDLKHSAGTAEAIVKAGGKSIQHESDDIMKKRRYYRLNPGHVVVTKAGNLPCNMIVHAVGPRWHNYQYQRNTATNILYSAVLNSFTVASQYGATSISMPAINTGIFGVPVVICAEMLFNAVTAFSKNAPASNSLRDIRFVNIDQQTTQVFAQEIQKRFGDLVKREILPNPTSKATKTSRS